MTSGGGSAGRAGDGRERQPFDGDTDAEAPFVIRRAQLDRDVDASFPQGVGGKAADEYVAAALERLRAKDEGRS